MSSDAQARAAFGMRLAAARSLSKYTLEEVADILTEQGYKYGKAAIGAWEKGRTVPDAIVLALVARLYGTTSDALLFGDTLSIEAQRFATQFDKLSEEQQRAFRGMWTGYVDASSGDRGTVIDDNKPTKLLPAARRRA